MDTQAVDLLIGLVMPPVIDLVNRFVANEKVRYAVAVLMCTGVGVLLNLKSLSLADFLESAALVFASATTVYKTWYGGSSLQRVVRD